MGDNDQEIRAIAELAVHIRYMREQIDNLSQNMATQDDIAQLRKEIEDNSPSALFQTMTKIATGIVAFSAAVGVIIAILKWGKAI